MAALDEFLSAAIYLPRRNDEVTRDVEEAFFALESAGFVLDPTGQLRIAMPRRIPELTGDTPGGRVYDGAVTTQQAMGLMRRVSAEYWGQVMLRGKFAIGGHFEGATAVVCPFSLNSPALFSAHLLFRKPGLLLKDRAQGDRSGHAVEALERLQDSLAPVLMFLDTDQPEIDVARLKAGKLPWLPWAGYLSPGALRSIGGGALQALPEWLGWLDDALQTRGVSGSRRTKGGGLIFALPERDVGRGSSGVGARITLEPWRNYLKRAVG